MICKIIPIVFMFVIFIVLGLMFERAFVVVKNEEIKNDAKKEE